MLDGAAAAEIASLLRDAGGDAVICAGRGADLAAVRELAGRYGARLAVSRPHVEAGRATRMELVGASSNTVAPRVYLALGVSGTLPHLIGMHGSQTVVAVNRDPDARIFNYADVGVVGDSAGLVESLAAL
jgi:electron transfer flavoprotein alpha subunit